MKTGKYKTAYILHRERFWENLTTPLFGTLTPPSDTTEVLQLFLSRILKDNNCVLKFFFSPALCSGDLCFCHGNHWSRNLLCCQVIFFFYPILLQPKSLVIPVYFLKCVLLLQWFFSAVPEGWAAEVLQCSTL